MAANLCSSRLAFRTLTRFRSAAAVSMVRERIGASLQNRVRFPYQNHQLCWQQSRLPSRHFSVSSASLKQTRKYTKEHEWVTMQDNIGVIGITDYAQDHLGDLVYVSLPEVGHKLLIGDEFGTVESVKAASELFCPISGEVVEVNPELEDKPELINKSCYDKGWLIKVKVKDAESQVEKLLTEEEYEEYLKTLV